MLPGAGSYYVDGELKLVHLWNTCPEASVALKYGYLKYESIKSVENAAEFDERGLKPCPRCLKKASREKNPPPGFRGLPPKGVR